MTSKEELLSDVWLSDVTENELALLQVFAKAAKKGERAPTTPQLQRLGIRDPSGTAVRLALKGVITIYVYGSNWRVIKIKCGSAKGCKTKDSPGGGPAYFVVDEEGRHEDLI